MTAAILTPHTAAAPEGGNKALMQPLHGVVTLFPDRQAWHEQDLHRCAESGLLATPPCSHTCSFCGWATTGQNNPPTNP
eukprot:scaffold62186_cov76-Phaeocystis_antarctica.AAC.1